MTSLELLSILGSNDENKIHEMLNKSKERMIEAAKRRSLAAALVNSQQNSRK